jgi:hypothetical protein
MKARHLLFWLVALATISAGRAQTQGASATGQSQGASASGQSQSKDSSTDATQSIVSPLGMGTGATLAVTQKGTDVTAAIARQMVNSPINFWQVGVFGSLNKNGQQEIYSSSDADAPGFKAKVGVGHSSMIRTWHEWNASAGVFMLHAWCVDLVAAVGETLPDHHAPDLKTAADCRQAVNIGRQALAQFPPVDLAGNVDQKNMEVDQDVLNRLSAAADHLTGQDQANICSALASSTKLFQTCTNPKGLNDEQKKYPALAANKKVTGEPSELQWKAWASWLPTVTSTPYRPLVGGVYDLSNKQNWTKLLNAAVGDVALYYGRIALGVEGGYGQTAKIVTQNVCNNTVSGTYTAQQCDIAMLGEPKPVNSWLASTTLQITPLPILAKGVPLTPGAEVTFSYTAPTSGGHSSELAVPIYLAPATSPLSFVIGLQPTWDWNTDPKVGNKFSVTLFVGARPPVPAPVTR